MRFFKRTMVLALTNPLNFILTPPNTNPWIFMMFSGVTKPCGLPEWDALFVLVRFSSNGVWCTSGHRAWSIPILSILTKEYLV